MSNWLVALIAVLSVINAAYPPVIALITGVTNDDSEYNHLYQIFWGYIWKHDKLNLFGKIFLEIFVSTVCLPMILLAYIVTGILHLAVIVFILLFVKKEKDNE